MNYFGKVNLDADKKTQSSYKAPFKIQEGVDNIYRIAPPVRSLLKTGAFAVFKAVHFGYGVADDATPEKIRARPFECIQKIDYKTKMVLQECPECRLLEQQMEKFEALKQKLADEGKSAEMIKNATMPYQTWFQQHNLDKKWYCYAKNLSGEWNILKLGHKLKMKLEDKMKRLLKEEGIEALSADSGVWFKFTKNGLKGSAADTDVEVVMEQVKLDNGKTAKVVKSAPLTQEDADKIDQLPDVTTSYTKLTHPQIKSLVDSGGDTKVAAQVFAQGQRREGSPKPETASTPATAKVEPKVETAAPAPAPASVGMTPDEFLKSLA